MCIFIFKKLNFSPWTCPSSSLAFSKQVVAPLFIQLLRPKTVFDSSLKTFIQCICQSVSSAFQNMPGIQPFMLSQPPRYTPLSSFPEYCSGPSPSSSYSLQSSWRDLFTSPSSKGPNGLLWPTKSCIWPLLKCFTISLPISYLLFNHIDLLVLWILQAHYSLKVFVVHCSWCSEQHCPDFLPQVCSFTSSVGFLIRCHKEGALPWPPYLNGILHSPTS